MRLYIVYTAFFVCFSSGNLLFGSEKIFEHKESSSYVFGYSTDQPIDNSTTNYFIKEIAKFKLSGLFNTNFIFHYELNNEIKLTSPNTFNVSSILSGKKCTGDILYKGFDISDILMPEKVDVTIVVSSKQKYIISKDFFGINFDENNHCQLEFEFESLDEDIAYELKLEKIRFYSETKDQEKFNNRLNQIDDYFASIAVLDHTIEEFRQINIEANSIVEFYIILKELERTYHEVKNGRFLKELDIRSNDLGGYFDKLSILKNQLARYTEYFGIIIQSKEVVKFNKSVKNYAGFYVNEATRYLSLSQTVTHSHSNYFFNLGKIEYDHTMIYQYYNDIEEVLKKSIHHQYSYRILQILQQEIYDSYLNQASSLINDHNYHIAIGVIQNAEYFYKATKNLMLPVSLNILKSQANYGIFDSYLKLIDRAIEVGNYDLAENYLKKAMEFQKSNSISIISDDYIVRISEELALLYIDKGNQLNEVGDFKNAIYSFEQALQLCHRIGRFNYDYEIKHGLMSARNGQYKILINQIIDDLEKGQIQMAKKLLDEANQLVAGYYYEIIYSPEHVFIRSAINHYDYKELIFEGKTLLETGNYKLAYEKFLVAFNLEAKSNFEMNDELPELFFRAATPVLVDLCSLGEVKVRKNQLNEARDIYNTCFTLQEEYGLIYQPNVQESLTMLNNSIFNRHCDMVNQEFEQIINSFDNLIDQGDFISAVNLMNSTEKLTYKNYYCDLDKSLVSELKAKYSPAAEYQQLAKDAQEALTTNDHEKFIEVHERMQFLSSNYEVIRKYIEPLPLHYLFSVKKNLAFLENSIQYFRNKEEFETALDLLAVLEANNYSDKETKSIQQKLGNKMALADKECIYTADPSVIVDEYTEGNSYLKHFKKAYIKNW